MSTHQKKIARAVQRATGDLYSSCLNAVRLTAADGKLPQFLDDTQAAAEVVLNEHYRNHLWAGE